MALNFGLTENGFVKPTYDEILDSIQDDFMAAFGDNIALGSNTQAGTLCMLFAKRLARAYDQAQGVYYDGFVSTATGTALDRLAANVGLTRHIATTSMATIVIKTDDEYLIQAGEKFETEDGLMFTLLKDVLTTQNSDGTWSGTGQVQSDDTGSMTNVLPNKITVVSDPDIDILSVTNPESAKGGQDYEDDELFRERIIMENTDRPSPTRNGIESALYNVNGVRQVFIADNKDGTVDQYGNPAYSVHIYVLGGLKEDIAQAIEDHKAVGTDYVGTQAVETTTATGDTEVIHFDYAQERPIYIKLDITVNDEWNSDEGVDNVKSAIADEINDLHMGNSIHLTKLYPTIYDIAGIDDATVLIGTSTDNVSDKGVPIQVFEAPTCDPKNIEVTVHGL